METTPLRITTPLTLAAGFLLAVSAHGTTSFVNGDFEGYLGNTNTHNSDVPPGWTTTGGTPDTFDANTDFGGYAWKPSNSGGQFLHGIGLQPNWIESAIQEAVTGLIIGDTYEISFEQSISNNTWAETGGFWRIIFGDESHDSEHMDLPESGETHDWIWHTMYFTATAESQRLEVMAVSDTDGLRTDLGIDGFYLGEPRENPPGQNLPDPVDPGPSPVPDTGATVLILGLANLGLLGLRRRLKK